MVAECDRTIVAGNPLDPKTVVGPLIHHIHENRVLEYIAIGLAGGATLAADGTKPDLPGCYVSPTLFTQAYNRMRIAQEEIFGPVLTAIPIADEWKPITPPLRPRRTRYRNLLDEPLHAICREFNRQVDLLVLDLSEDGVDRLSGDFPQDAARSRTPLH